MGVDVLFVEMLLFLKGKWIGLIINYMGWLWDGIYVVEVMMK